MKLNPYCMCCQISRQEKKIRKFTDMQKKVEYMQKIMEIMANAGPEHCAPSISISMKKLFSEYWGTPEDFTRIKHEFNTLMLNLEDKLEQKIRSAGDPLATALLYSRIGNYIDFSALAHVEKDVVISMLEDENKEPLDAGEYANFLCDVSAAKRLVYLTDNCGEIVLDKIAIRLLIERFPNLDITVIVRGLPVANDATMEDAQEVGLTSLVKVIGNGDGVGGTWFPGINRETRELLESADVILAKGQGNFETMHDCGLNIYYLFLCKCEWFRILFHAKPLQGMFVNERRVSSICQESTENFV